VSAAPLKRSAAGDANDVLVLRFAITLENLETEFYQGILGKFTSDDFTDIGAKSGQAVLQQFAGVESDESTHATVLTSVLLSLNATPIEGCQFDVSGLIATASTALTSAQTVENVGVGAYLGAANLIQDPHILTAAASILSIEARHNTIFNMLNQDSPIPQAFDIPLSPNEVLATAGQFISNCSLGITANTPLTVTNTGVITPGTTLTFQSTAFQSVNGMFCQILTGGANQTISLPANNCIVPPGTDGPMAVFVTPTNTPLSGDVIDRQSQNATVGPALVFSHGVDDLLSDLVRPKL